MNGKKLEKLEAKIRELVPRLKELSFGCEVRISDFYLPNEGSAIVIFNDKKMISVICDNKVRKDFRYGNVPNHDFETIGHPITLEDVLESIEEYKKQKFNVQTTSAAALFVASNHWQYGKHLPQQPKKTINFLYSLFFDES